MSIEAAYFCAATCEISYLAIEIKRHHESLKVFAENARWSFLNQKAFCYEEALRGIFYTKKILQNLETIFRKRIKEEPPAITNRYWHCRQVSL